MEEFDNKHPKYKQLKLYYFATPDAHSDMFVEQDRVRHMWTTTPLSDVVKGSRVSFYDNKKQRDDDFFAWTQRHKSNTAYFGELVINAGKAARLKTMMDISEELPE